MTYVRQTKPGKNKRILVFSLIGIILVSLIILLFTYRRDGAGQVTAQGDIPILEQRMVNVVRACQKISAGEMADAQKFEIVAVPKELAPSEAISSLLQLKGKRVANEIGEKEFLLQSDLVDSTLWYEQEDRLMEQLFQPEAIPATIQVGSVVDIKLFRPKNMDDIVVAKAVVIGKSENTLSFYFNKAEQEYIKEANTEGLLFLVQYLDKLQPASMVTYTPLYIEENAE